MTNKITKSKHYITLPNSQPKHVPKHVKPHSNYFET